VILNCGRAFGAIRTLLTGRGVVTPIARLSRTRGRCDASGLAANAPLCTQSWLGQIP